MIKQMEPKDTGTASRPSPSKRDFLAAGRTAMAAGRSFTGWTTTGTTIIAFGFTIYRYIMSLSEGLTRNDALGVGLFLIGIGTAVMLYGIADYWKTMRELHQDYGVQFRKTRLLFGLLMAGFGVFLFFTILIRNMQGVR